jgi:hypothetical protein
MNCPKCAAEHDGTRQECPSCGIIFARWQSREPRKPTAPGIGRTKPATKRVISPTAWVILSVVLFFGIGFVGLSFLERFKPMSIRQHIADPNPPVDQQAVWKFESDQQRKDIRRRNGASPDRAPDLPGDIDRARILSLLQDCRYFQTPVTVEIPKSFMVASQDSPSHRPIAAARMAQLIVFDKDPFFANRYDTIQGRINPAAYAVVDVFETDDSIRFTLGRRKPEVTGAWGKSDSSASATFTWKFEHEAAANLAGDPDERKGYADFERWNSVWTMSSAWKDTKPPDRICP